MEDVLVLPPRDPLKSLVAWLDEARRRGIPLAEAVCLATATTAGDPSARMVLFRGIENGRLAFFTDYRSRKASELEANPKAALVFYWHALGRQVRVEGTTERLEADASDRYFLKRRRESRISAWTSHQSAEIEDRDRLERRRVEIERRFEGREVTRPEFWGGYALYPQRIEFWQERDHRFHERVAFTRSTDTWRRTLLQP